MKVIFDRPAFDGVRFDALEGSRLLQRTREAKLSVFYTTVFLDETVRTASSTGARAQGVLKRRWPFLVSICNGGWFRPLLIPDESFPGLKSIFEEEFEGGEKAGDWLLVPDSDRRKVEEELTRPLKESRPIPELENARPIYGQIQQTREQNWAAFVALRQQRLPPGQPHLPLEPFAQYYRLNAEEFASCVIGQLPALDQPERKLDAWKRDPEKFPHFTAYVQLYAYVHYDPQLPHQPPMDPNCLADAEQLCFLEDVDAMLSFDQGFMKRAFEAVWEPRGKRLFTPEEFVDQLQREDFA
jgi:hypothetical protein